MYSRQLRGPFIQGQTQTISLNTVYKILKIGIEYPYSIPIQRYQLAEDSNLAIHIAIDGEKYMICDNNILEIDNLYQSSITLTFLQNLDEYAIVDLTFIDADDGNDQEVCG